MLIASFLTTLLVFIRIIRSELPKLPPNLTECPLNNMIGLCNLLVRLTVFVSAPDASAADLPARIICVVDCGVPSSAAEVRARLATVVCFGGEVDRFSDMMRTKEG
jgi:hypothetical protein